MKAKLIKKALKNQSNNIIRELNECSACGAYVYGKKTTTCETCGAEFHQTEEKEEFMKLSHQATAELEMLDRAKCLIKKKDNFIECPTCKRKVFIIGQTNCMWCGQRFKW